MSADPEQGNGWEIKRGFVTPERANVLGEQVLWVIEDDSIHLESMHEHEKMSNVTIYEISDWRADDMPDLPATVYLREAIPDVITLVDEIIAARQQLTDDKILFNYFHPYGEIYEHSDRGDLDREAVTLFGYGRFYVKDLETGIWHDFVLGPGDAVEIHNQGRFNEGPLHKVENLGKKPRLSLVK